MPPNFKRVRTRDPDEAIAELEQLGKVIAFVDPNLSIYPLEFLERIFMYDVIIIGAGCTGFAAAMYSGRFKMKTLILGELIGGLITWTDSVENYPGFNKITGQELADKLRNHALEYKIDFKEYKKCKGYGCFLYS